MSSDEEADPSEDSDEAPKGSNGGNGSSTKARSGTAYPYYSLAVAVTLVHAVRRAGGSEAASADVMRELSVKKVADRQWSYGVPAAILFGLIERVGRGEEGRIKLTALANRIALPDSVDEERAAKVAAFKKPELYARLLEKYAGHPPPPKDGLKNLLHRDFLIVESMASIAADAFLDSLKYAELITAKNVVAGGPEAPLDKVKKPREDNGHSSEQSTKTITVPTEFIVYKCKISGGRVIELPLPPTFTQADMKRLNAFLQTQVDDSDDDAGA